MITNSSILPWPYQQSTARQQPRLIPPILRIPMLSLKHTHTHTTFHLQWVVQNHYLTCFFARPTYRSPHPPPTHLYCTWPYVRVCVRICSRDDNAQCHNHHTHLHCTWLCVCVCMSSRDDSEPIPMDAYPPTPQHSSNRTKSWIVLSSSQLVKPSSAKMCVSE